MSLPAESVDPIARAAAAWVIRRDRGLSAAEMESFLQWRAEDPRHASEFDRIAAGWQLLDEMKSVPVLNDAADAILLRARSRRSRSRRLILTCGLAAAAALALAVLAPWRTESTSRDNYQVIASTSRIEKLPDGTVVQLNGDSRIETAFTPAERKVRLLHGEASFAVVKHPARPFFVTAGPVTVRAVGTAFNVRLGQSAVEVLVTEGKVRVDDTAQGKSLLPPAPTADDISISPEAPGILTAGQRVVVNLAAVVDPASQVQVAAVAPYEIDQSLSWQSTQLVFNDTPLDEVVLAFNKYNDRRLSLGDDSLRDRKVTGVFRADNVDGFLRLAEAGLDVKAVSGEHVTLLLPGR